jgi:hypothetical protein
MQDGELEEVKQFFAGYGQTFEEFNAEKLVAAYTLPCLFAGPTGVTTWLFQLGTEVH